MEVCGQGHRYRALAEDSCFLSRMQVLRRPLPHRELRSNSCYQQWSCWDHHRTHPYKVFVEEFREMAKTETSTGHTFREANQLANRVTVYNYAVYNWSPKSLELMIQECLASAYNSSFVSHFFDWNILELPFSINMQGLLFDKVLRNR